MQKVHDGKVTETDVPGIRTHTIRMPETSLCYRKIVFLTDVLALSPPKQQVEQHTEEIHPYNDDSPYPFCYRAPCLILQELNDGVENKSCIYNQ